MDYGKMAYLRTEELEAKLGKQAQALPKNPSLYRYALGGGRHTLMSFSSDVPRAVMLNVRADCDGGTLYLLIGGLRAAFSRLEKGKQTCVMLATGSGDIELDALSLSSVRSLEAELLLPSGGGDEETGGNLRAAYNDGVYMIAQCGEGDVKLISTDEKYEEKRSMDLGGSVYADVCACGSGFAVVFSDLFGQLWCAAADADLNIGYYSPLGTAPKRFSITAVGSRVFVFYAEDGKIKYFSTTYPIGARGYEADADYSTAAQRVETVKDAVPIAITVNSYGSSYLIKEQTDATVTTKMKIGLKVVAGNV